MASIQLKYLVTASYRQHPSIYKKEKNGINGIDIFVFNAGPLSHPGLPNTFGY
ncbi:hypothetical protein [Variovorax boronicumulans]|uniref:hypothetical protein n=1 Tax=Variovorax boronicumulans TaxID=436515 RepID=UPI001552CF82|nr:hypothetical protein [Variovorax boronicumulans]